jgi:hypothetical protein
VGVAGIGEIGVGGDPERHLAEPEVGSIHVRGPGF